MTFNPKSARNEPQAAYGSQIILDDGAVLRLSRASLRAQPPVVQFVERPATLNGQQKMLWPA